MQINSYAGFTVFRNECKRCEIINNCSSKSTMQTTTLIEENVLIKLIKYEHLYFFIYFNLKNESNESVANI